MRFHFIVFFVILLSSFINSTYCVASPYKTVSYPAPRTQGSPAIGVNSSGGRAIITTTPPPIEDPSNLSRACTVIYITNKKGVIIRKEVHGQGCDKDEFFGGSH